MKFFKPFVLVLFAFLAIQSFVIAQMKSPAFFDASTLQKIMDHRECTGVRFYNVVEPTSQESSAMVIGIREDGSEISNLTNRYFVFVATSPTGVDYQKINGSKAAEACQKVKDNGDMSFSASFSKEDVKQMVQTAEADGLLVKQVEVQAVATFEVQAASLSNGEAAPLPGSAATINGEPCPTCCGNSSNYVNM